MDLVDLGILALRLALALLLYLFLWLVVRSAWHALRTAPEPAPRARAAPVVAERAAAAPAAEVRTLLTLVVLDAGDSDLLSGQLIELADGATLGRAERASVLVSDSAVSAEHARFARRAGGWVVADLGSTNGTLVNQAPVTGEVALAAGDVVSLGKVRLKVAAE